jgi:hypothetical protein
MVMVHCMPFEQGRLFRQSITTSVTPDWETSGSGWSIGFSIQDTAFLQPRQRPHPSHYHQVFSYKIATTGVLTESFSASSADWENPAVVHGFDYRRTWILSKREACTSSSPSRSRDHALRSMAATLLSRSGTTTRLPIPLHI